MGRAIGNRNERVRAASFFVQRAHEAMAAAELAGSEAAAAAFCKEAETWLFMAHSCLDPARAARPQALAPPPRRVGHERRSFGGED